MAFSDKQIYIEKDNYKLSGSIIPEVPEFIYPNASEHDLCTVQHWGFFSKKEIHDNAGKLLMLDIDLGRDCSLRCPTCFRRNNIVDDSGDSDLSFEEILGVIKEAKNLGLRAVKICGAGEPLEYPNLLRFARQLTEWGIGLSIFTKGHVLGDEDKVKDVFSQEGISDTESLARKLYDLKTSILLGFQSFRPHIQDQIVGNMKGHTLRRNRALELLTKVGFNKTIPTRLMLCATPVRRETYQEMFDFYVFCRRRNILPLITLTMISGKQFNDHFIKHIDLSYKQKNELYTKIYEYNIEHSIQSLDNIINDGISSMPGIHPCNQIATGLYITINGNVVSCPGDSEKIVGNVRKESVKNIWHRSDNNKRKGIYNNGCPFKEGKTIPVDLYTNVKNHLITKYLQ